MQETCYKRQNMDEKDVCIKQYEWFERVCKKHQYKAKTIQL